MPTSAAFVCSLQVEMIKKAARTARRDSVEQQQLEDKAAEAFKEAEKAARRAAKKAAKEAEKQAKKEAEKDSNEDEAAEEAYAQLVAAAGDSSDSDGGSSKKSRRSTEGGDDSTSSSGGSNGLAGPIWGMQVGQGSKGGPDPVYATYHCECPAHGNTGGGGSAGLRTYAGHAACMHGLQDASALLPGA